MPPSALRTRARLMLARVAVGVLLACLALPLAAQITDGINVGLPENGVFTGSDFDTIQTNNGALHVEIPLWSVKGRGPAMYYKFAFNRMSFTVSVKVNSLGQSTAYIRESPSGWALADPVSYNVTATQMSAQLCSGGSLITAYKGVTMTEPDGTQHHFIPDQYNECFSPIPNGLMYADDGSGWALRVDPNTSNPNYNGLSWDLVRKDGAEEEAVWNSTYQANDQTLTDSNGNEITYNPVNGTITDTLGRTSVPPQSWYTAGSHTITYVDSSGNARSIEFTIISVPISTHLCQYVGATSCFEYGGSEAAPSEITLPNGLKYTFAYTQDGYGELASVTLPTGGQLSWTWEVNSHTNYSPVVTSRTLVADGHTYVWNYSYSFPSGGWVTTETDPLGNDTQYTCQRIASTTRLVGAVCQTTETQYFNGSAASNNPIKTATKAYDNTTTATVLPISETTTWNQTNQVSKVSTTWDSYNTGPDTVSWRNPIQRQEYDYGTGAPGALLRSTTYNYLHLTNSTYRLQNIADRLTSKVVANGSGGTVAQTTYVYDGSALTSTSGAPGHDYTHFGSSNTIRGNVTEEQRWLNTNNSWLTTSHTYNDLGDGLSTADPLGYKTSFSYTDNWANSYCVPSGVTTYAFVTLITDALGHQTQKSYYPCTSLLASARDQNDINAGRAGTTYAYDLVNRTMSASYPDGGLTTFSFNDALPLSFARTQAIISGTNLVETTVLDDLGRVKQTQLNSDPQGVTYVDTTHDALGRAATASNPYRTTSDPTYGITTYQYDPLSRTIKITRADGSAVNTSYSGNCTTVTDEAGKIRESCADALGRVTQVFEPDSSNSLSYETDYQFDALVNLTQVQQKGGDSNSADWRTRSFSYDSLSRLLSSSNPEAGTVSYSYDADGNMISKTDARGIATTYSYDALNRLTGISYSDNDPGVTYSYDQTSYDGLSISNGVGRRTGMADAAGAEAWSYDPMGRVSAQKRTTNAVTKTTSYSYNLDGSLATLTYPTGRVVTYATGSDGRPVSAVDQANGIGYAQAATYAPQGALAYLQNGASIYSTRIYNSRLQPCWFYVTTGTALAWSTTLCTASAAAGNILDLKYGFNLGAGDNGNIVSIGNNRTSARTQNFAYDQLNRIASATTSSTSGSYCWGEQFGYDPWGNLKSITAASGYNSCTQENLSLGMSGANQITNSGFSYDPSGNLLADGVNSYAWNAESEMKSAAGVTYTYDGDGNRVEKSNGTLYWYTSAGLSAGGPGGGVLDETDLSGNLTSEYVYFAGQRIARRDASANIFYYAEDFLGSSREIVQAGQTTACYDADFYPYGGERAYTNTCVQRYKFMSHERDAESGLDDFGARYYSSQYGRFMSADWSAIPVPVPYANFTNPQTLNLYAIVHDNPETFADLDGHAGDESPTVGGPTNPANAAKKKQKKNPPPPPPKPKKSWAQRARELYQRDSAEFEAWKARHQSLVNAVILSASIAVAIASRGEGAEGLEGQEEGAGEPGLGVGMTGKPSTAPPADPAQSPGPGWEWRGSGPSGSSKGSWYNPSTGESLHPDLQHAGPQGPHWDYKNGLGQEFRILPDGTSVPK